MLRWALASVTFLVITAVVFLPMLFLLASTPLHDGDDLPGPLLFFSTVIVSSVLGIAAGWLIYRLLRTWSSRNGTGVEA